MTIIFTLNNEKQHISAQFPCHDAPPFGSTGRYEWPWCCPVSERL